MSREWKPGDVAIWDHGDAGRTDVIFRFLGGDDYDTPEWQTDTDGCGYPVDAQLRRAVVIDPENREQVERLVRACPDDWALTQDPETVRECTDALQAALRSLVAPPKPEEPTDPAVRVIDRDGLAWARWRGDWQPLGSGKFAPLTWDALVDRRGPMEVES